ncbi:MAG TPA: aminotransferase class V-fold PLP-dependent enzyme [Tepidisphaeraceae bacterium]|nr:aminotransferase class V-fold PLP-dependent enzyme [Tepidisphaeraceae bacterium]
MDFLNHGSFGAMPRPVFEAQDAWRRRIEADPIELIGRQCAGLVAEARKPVAKFLGMEPDDFGFVTNATEGINCVLQSLALAPGDELLTTDHVYHAIRQAMRRCAARAGAAVREVAVPLPVRSGEQIAQIVLAAISPRTRLLVIDHVTSPTGLVFPVEQIIAGCAKAGVDVLVDGAHAPGMLPLNIGELRPAYYAANLHKWCCGSKGSALLWVRPDKQKDIHPAVISHFLGEGFTREFAWQGTRDLSAWLAVPHALAFMESLGLERVMAHNHAMAAWAHRLLCRRLKLDPISPLDGSMLGSMAAVALPALAGISERQRETLQQRLYSEFHLEAPLMLWNGQCLLRVSCQVYNTPEQYERLVDAIGKLGT